MEGHQTRSCPGNCGAQSAQPDVVVANGGIGSEAPQSFAAAVTGLAPASAAVFVIKLAVVSESMAPLPMAAQSCPWSRRFRLPRKIILWESFPRHRFIHH